jgi:hypothetical protein
MTAMSSCPTFDGHFWIERDGEIIDWDFTDHKYIKQVNKLTDEKVYLPASDITQTIMTTACKKTCGNKCGSFEKFEDDIFNCINKQGKLFGNCFLNCIHEVKKNGGKIVFGSFGWKRKNGDGVHYEFGGENYKTFGDFMMKTDAYKIARMEAQRRR